MTCLRKLFISVFLFTLYFQLSADPSFHVNWDTIEENLTTIELNWKELETNNAYLIQQLTNVSTMLQEEQKYSAQLQLQSEDLKNRLKKQELYTKIWKGSCVVSVAVLPVVTILIYERLKK